MNIAAKEVEINSRVRIGGANPLFLIGGPCVIESEDHALGLAHSIKSVCEDLKIPFIFKASYDKANRSSIKSYRGPGLDRGLKILQRIKGELQIPVLSDVHETIQVSRAAEVLDVIQIPAFLSRQTDLILEAAKTGKPLNIKKGQFLSPNDMRNVIDKVLSQGNGKLILTERGTSFGYNTLVFDVRSIPTMKQWGFPVVIDASHCVQKPGGEGDFSGGESEFIPLMAKAGIAAGADGLFLEIHDNPSQALSDSHNSFNINNLKSFLSLCLRIKNVVAEADNPD
ncbi:MAG TPA: 3-deoxy-8-phosphooctulonate synthase [Candidatus Heimdallarchaeota archaeon]|nr:3-deoxy-8-phosphooctulonate synthase [Candidatus Heimdallarchaeota archaeon]